MSTRNDRFNASMRSLDELTASFKDPSKAEVFSDKGLGVERMLDEIDHTLGQRASCPLGPHPATGETPVAPVPVAPVRDPMKLHRAEMRLYRAGLGHLVRVLRLIAKNGNNRKESIWELAKSRLGR